MIEQSILLFLLALLLAAITVIGHGLWTIVAWLLGCTNRDTPAEDGAKCPRCGQLNSPRTTHCDECGQALLAEEMADIDATRRQMRRMQQSGHLKPTTVKKLLVRLARYRRDRIGLPPLDRTAAQTMPTPTATSPVTTAGCPSDILHAPPAAAELPACAGTSEVEFARPEVVHPAVHRVPVRPRRLSEPPETPWQDAVADFLAEREIHWAEMIGVLVGGFIMVGSSIALVVNLWQFMEHVPYLKFLIFVAYTSLVLVAGLYAFHRWRLRSTGGGLLTIGTLLVPLDFLAMASLWRSGLDYGAIAAEVIALVLFAGLIRLAAGTLMPDGRWLGPLAVVGNSAAILGMARVVHEAQPAWLLAAAVYVPVAVFAVAMGAYLFRLSARPELRGPDCAALMVMLGTSTFALCVPMGLYIAEALRCFGGLPTVLNLLAVPAALTAIPILATGIRLTPTTSVHGATDHPLAPPTPGSCSLPSGRNATAASYRAAGAAIALLAVVLQILALGLAWPDPQSLIAVGLFNAAGLAFVAVRYRFPAAHGGVMACLAMSYLIGFHWAIGNLDGLAPSERGAALLRLALAAQSGTALAGMFVAFGLASWHLANKRDPRHGKAYAAGAATAAVAGLILVSYHGLATGMLDAVRAAALYAAYGTGACALAARRKDRSFAYLGVLSWAATPLWLLWLATGEVTPVSAAVLAAEAFAAAMLAQVASRVSLDSGLFSRPLRHVGSVLASLAMAAWLATGLTHEDAIRGAWPPVATVAILAVFFFQQAWWSGGRTPTWAGSLVVFAGLLHSLVLNFAGWVAEPWLIAPLVHASGAMAAALAIEAVANRGAAPLRGRLVNVLAEPLAGSALLASGLLVLFLPMAWRTNWTFCQGLFWLAAIWLVYAVRHGSVAAFNAHFVAAAAGTATGATLWLRSRGYYLPADAIQPACLHAYGISLAAMTIPWAWLRLASRRIAGMIDAPKPPFLTATHTEAPAARAASSWTRNGSCLLATRSSLDIALRYCMVFVQLLLAMLWLAPELARELGLPARPIEAGVFALGDGGAWLLFAMLAAGLLADFRHRCGRLELLVGLALLGVAPWLLASYGVQDVAVATFLRWTAALGFLGVSAILWRRRDVARLIHAMGVRWQGIEQQGGTGATRSGGILPADRLVHAALIVLALLPVAAITVAAAMLRVDYVTPRGPLAESPLYALGYRANYLLPLVFLAMGLIGTALRERSGGYAIASCLAANLAVFVMWQPPGPLDGHGLLLTQAIALASAAAFWTIVKLALPDRAPPLSLGAVEAAPNHLAILAGVGLLLLLVVISAVGGVTGEYRVPVGRLDVACLVLIALGVILCLWDATARFPLAALYFLAFAAEGLWLEYRELGPREYLWNAAPELAGIMIIAAVVAWRLRRTERAWRILRIPMNDHRWSYHWFQFWQVAIGMVVAALAFWVAFDVQNDGVGTETALFNLHGRRTGPSTALLLLGTSIVMAWQTQRSRRRLWQTAAFGAGFLLNLALGLASLDTNVGSAAATAPWLNRCAVLLTAATMLTLLSRVGLQRVLPRSGDWIDAGRDVAPAFATVAGITLPILLVGEAMQFHPVNGAPLPLFSAIAIAVLLLAAALACVTHAVRSARSAIAGFGADGAPHGSIEEPELSPQAFVYAAEAILAMGTLHLWLCRPQWFHLGILEQYWLLLVMVAAYLGVGVSEWFRRVDLPVLCEPLRNTALVLPLVPMAGFWFMPPSESCFGFEGGAPALWLLMAVFYGIQAAGRPTSVLLGSLTLFTGSMGLWVVLDRQSLDFFTHPQVWLIPPALAVLVAERLERPRLDASQRDTLRYAALSVIYVASTTEFLRGVGNSIWLPLVLLLLCVAGVFAGIVFRIRGYVYLGLAFLAVVITRMIGYAAFEQGQMWLFWVCCILLGVAIFIVSAVFERRREVFIAAARKLRQWER